MITVKWDGVCWRCDICSRELWSPPTVLYSQASGKNHYPAVILACSRGCETKALTQLTVEPVLRMRWTKFLDGLNKAVADAST